MDNDNLRRGELSIHAIYRNIANTNNYKSPEDYSHSMGMCSGDIAMFISFHTLINASLALKKNQNILSFITKEFLQVGFAQMNDVEFSYSSKTPSIQNISEMYTHKTARYTFSLPFVLGCCLSNQTKLVIRELDRLGENIGMLFQLRDDELGLFQSTDTIGKQSGSDIRENKKTILMSLLIEACNQKDKILLKTLVNQHTISNTSIQQIYSLIKKYKIMEKINVLKQEYKQKSIQSITSLHISKKYTSLLLELVDYVSNRNK
jgi:geranylgeranyl diphosphate synthase, type I